MTTSNLNVRATASVLGTLLGTQPLGAIGTLVSGPIISGGYTWWYVNYETGADGWSAQEYFTKTAPAPVGQTPYGGAAAVIPGTIEAERYDLGGEGLAYHDAGSTNIFNQFRTDGVDVKTCTDTTGCGHALGFVEIGDWTEYTVNVTQVGAYIFSARVASVNPGQTFHIEIDNVNVTGSIVVPQNQTAWDTSWVTVTVPNINLTAGQHIMRFSMESNNFLDVNSFTWTYAGATVLPSATPIGTVVGQDPYDGIVANIPGTIEAEKYNVGAEGVAYHDVDGVNTLGQFRTDGVDIKACTDTTGCGYALGSVAQGEWTKYTVNVNLPGTYTFSARVAAVSAGQTFSIEMNGVNVTGSIVVPQNQTAWDTSWVTVSVPNIVLPGGLSVMRFVMETSNFIDVNNFKWVLTHTEIDIGSRVAPVTVVNVRSQPTTASAILGKQTTSAIGTVIDKVIVSGQTWYKVNFDTGADGWVLGVNLRRVGLATAQPLDLVVRAPVEAL